MTEYPLLGMGPLGLPAGGSPGPKGLFTPNSAVCVKITGYEYWEPMDSFGVVTDLF